MQLFKEYEREGLEIDNIWHIFTLQYMFMNRIQEELIAFKSHWNNHPLESERNYSPLQLILLRNIDINYDEPIDLENYGVDANIYDDEDDNEENEYAQVVCEPVLCPLSPENLLQLKQHISPLTIDIHQSELTDRFHYALNFVHDLREAQINAF